MGKAGSKHGGAAKKPQFDRTILETLPEDTKTKIDTAYVEFTEQMEELESNFNKYKTDSEQKQFELEKELIEKTESLENESKCAADLKSKLSNVELRYNDLSANLRKLQENSSNQKDTLAEAIRLKDHVEFENKNLAEALEKNNSKIDAQHEEISGLLQKLNGARMEKVTAQAKMEEAISETNVAKNRERQFEIEAENLRRQQKYLEEQLDEKNQKLLSIHSDHSREVIELKGQLELTKNEADKRKEINEALTVSNEQLNKTLDELNLKLKESRDMQTEAEESFRNEINAQEKLITLYKESSDAADKKIAEMSSAVEGLQSLLQQAVEAQRLIEEQRLDDAQKFEEVLSNKDESLSTLQKELSHCNELLEMARKQGVAKLSDEQVEAMSPSAAAASRLLKSGMTLTQIYAEYVQVSEELFTEKEESKKLSEYLDQVLKEIEEKAPIMKKHREDYEKAVEAVNHLTMQLDTALVECEKLREVADEERRKSGHANRENQRLKQQTVDLGCQVRILLKELEEARGNIVLTGRDDVSSPDVSSSSQIISERLVSFRSIEEMQQKNQHLLEVVRDLSESKEREEKEASNEKIRALKDQLDSALDQLESMKSARQRQADMVESIVRQRDMFKILLNQSNSTQLPLEEMQTSTPMPYGTRLSPTSTTPQTPRSSKLFSPDVVKAQEDTAAALKELQDEFVMYKKEKNTNYELLNEQLEKFRQETSELKIQNAKLSSQLDFGAERFKILQSNADGYKKEVTVLREKNQKFATSIIKHEHSVNQLRQEALLLQERLSQATIQLNGCKSECDMLKSKEARLLQEKEGLIREGRSQNVLLANLQTIQNNLERSDFEAKNRYERRIDTLERENTNLKIKVEDADKTGRNIVSTLEKQLTEINERLEKEKESSQILNEELHKTRQQNQQLKLDVKSLEIKLESTSSPSPTKGELTPKRIEFPAKPSTPASAEMIEKVKDLETQLQHSTTASKGLKEQLEKAKQNEEQYKTIAESVEENLRDQNAAMEQFKETTEAKLNEAIKAKEIAEKSLSALEVERQEIFNENITLTEKCHSMNVELRQQLQKSQAELEEVTEQRNSAVQNEKVAREDCKAQVKVAQDAQDNYQRELMLHSADVAALTAIKEELEGFNESLSKAEEEAREAKSALEAGQQLWSSQEEKYRTEERNLETRIEDLQQQNHVLHEQLEKLSQQMAKLQERNESDSNEAKWMTEQLQKGESSESAEKLLEVIRFLRREKEIAEARLEAVQAECNRYRQRTDHLEKQLKDTNKILNEERDKSQLNRQTAEQHAELMSKVQTMNLLTDSNKLLREERDRLNQNLQAAERKLVKLESDIVPLQQSLHEQQAQKETLDGEKSALQLEVERWKARTNHLIEQCNKIDPEEVKLLEKERDNLKKLVASHSEIIQKLRDEVSGLSSDLQTANAQVVTSAESTELLGKEIEEMKQHYEKKIKEAEDKAQIVERLRRLGTKYRNQAQLLQKENESLKELEKGAGAVQQKYDELKRETEENLAASQDTTRLAEDKVKIMEVDIAELREKVTITESEKDKAVQNLEEKEKECATLSEQIKKSQVEISKQKSEDTKAKQDLEKKIGQYKNVLQKSQLKLKEHQAHIEKITKDNEDLKNRSSTEQTSEESELRFNSLKSQYETTKATVERLEKELGEAKKKKVPTATLR